MADDLPDPFDAFGEQPLPPLASAADVRARGEQRRRRARAALAGGGTLAVVLAFTGGYALVGGGEDRLDSLRPDQVATAPSVTPSVDPNGCPAPRPEPGTAVCLPSPVPSSVPSPVRTSPSPASVPSPAPAPAPDPSPVPSASSPAPGQVSELLLTVADAQTTEDGTWARQPGNIKTPLLDPCAGGTDYPRDADIVDRAGTTLQTTREAGGTTAVQTLARYSSTEAAADAAAGYERAVRACPGSTDPQRLGPLTVVSSQTQGQTFTVLIRRESGCDVCYADYVAVQQRGDLVSVLAVSRGEDGDPGVAVVDPYLPLVAGKLGRS